MKILLLGLTLAVLSAPCQTRSPRAAAVTLYTSFQYDAPPAVLVAAREELARIMSPAGLSFEWRAVQAAGGVVSDELAVVKFTGRCVATLVSREPRPSPRLGWTHVTNGAILPFSGVDCDAIRGFLDHQISHMRDDCRDAAYGRALGRVLAHELYHIFAATEHHGSRGVAKASHEAAELLADSFELNEPDARAIREGKPKALIARAAFAE